MYNLSRLVSRVRISYSSIRNRLYPLSMPVTVTSGLDPVPVTLDPVWLYSSMPVIPSSIRNRYTWCLGVAPVPGSSSVVYIILLRNRSGSVISSYAFTDSASRLLSPDSFFWSIALELYSSYNTSTPVDPFMLGGV